MADDTNTDDLGALLASLGQYGVGAAGAAGANEVTQAAYRAIIKNLQDRFGEYKNLSPAQYKQLVAQQLGPSALAGIQADPQARVDEQAAIAQLDDIAKSGGLTLADKQALNQLEEKLGRATTARNASVANQFAARGQLGAGQQLAMQLAGNQEATQSANTRGEDIAAQAQQRAMEAVLKKGTAAHALSSEDYARKERAAEAADAIAKYNASMQTDAAKYNNTVAGQTYEDALKKLSGENAVTGQLNTALLGSGKQNANTIAGLSYGAGGLLGTVGTLAGKAAKSAGGSGGSGSNDPGLDQGGQDDLAGDRGGSGDLSGGNSLAGDDQGAGFDTTGVTETDPDAWAGWSGG